MKIKGGNTLSGALEPGLRRGDEDRGFGAGSAIVGATKIGAFAQDLQSLGRRRSGLWRRICNRWGDEDWGFGAGPAIIAAELRL